MMNDTVKQIFSVVGQKALFMLGYQYPTYDNANNSIQFKIRGSKKVTHIKIKVINDLYEVTFYKIRKFETKYEKTYSGIWNDMLHKLIEEETELYTKL